MTLDIIVFFKLIIECLCSFVRYGDKVPVGVCARLFAVVWIITGLVMASILVGVIATSLTFSTLDNEIILYGTKVHMLLPTHLSLCTRCTLTTVRDDLIGANPAIIYVSRSYKEYL